MSNLALQETFIDPRAKARLFALTRAYGEQRTSALEYRRGLQEMAGAIRGFGEFRQWCLEDIKAAFHEDRERGTRSAKNRRLAWLHLFKHFARLHQLDRALAIRALDRQGNYSCELVEKKQPDRWAQLLRLAEEFGITERDFIEMKARKARGAGSAKVNEQREEMTA